MSSSGSVGVILSRFSCPVLSGSLFRSVKGSEVTHTGSPPSGLGCATARADCQHKKQRIIDAKTALDCTIVRLHGVVKVPSNAEMYRVDRFVTFGDCVFGCVAPKECIEAFVNPA